MQPLADVPVGREQRLRDLYTFLGRGTSGRLPLIGGEVFLGRGSTFHMSLARVYTFLSRWVRYAGRPRRT